MGFILPVVVLCAFLGFTMIARTQTEVATPPTSAVQAQQAGQAFLAYRSALIAYQLQNPSFTGQVPLSALQGIAGAFPLSLLSSFGNAITAYGTSGRVATAYALVPIGAIAVASDLAEGDASIGTATSNTWKSFTPGAVAVPTATPVPDGAVVSVTQTGN